MANLTTPIIGGCSFDDLSKELKQMIFKWTATVNTNDIQVELEDDTSTKLQSPAIDLLMNLKVVSECIYYEAVYYLMGPSFRWVFISNTQPYRHLLRAFRDQVPLEIRSRITHVHLSRVTLYGLFPTEHTSKQYWRELKSASSRLDTNRSAYLDRMGIGKMSTKDHHFTTIKGDITAGMTLLFFVLPSITRLDVTLDSFECTPFLRPGETFLREEPEDYRPKASDFNRNAFLFELLRQNMKMKTIGQLDLRIFWDDFIEQRFQVDWSKEITAEFQDLFISSLKKCLPAKSITGHCKEPAIS